jgi:predicted dehydrogenase
MDQDMGMDLADDRRLAGNGRRSFLKVGAGAVAAMPFLGFAKGSASDRVRIGMIGCGNRSLALMEQFLRVPEVDLVALADPDTAQIDALKRHLAKEGIKLGPVAEFRDYRIMLERNDIDAVLIASPNHWHAMQAVDAMAAGKHAYVEKPVSHSIWESARLLAAEKRYGKVVAAGLQNRSDPGIKEAFEYLRTGALGKIQHIHVCGFRGRNPIGKRHTPLAPPATCDYNLWLGPAADLPILRDQMHYDWHWDWNTGNGEMGNQTPHELDLVQWLLGDAELPKAVRSIGGRFAWNDAGITPNLHVACYEQAGVPVTVEVNNLQISRTSKAGPARSGIRVGIIVRCEGGELRGGRGGMFAVGEDGKTRLKKFRGDAGAGHMANFIDAVRSESSGALAAPLKTGVDSAVVSHLANLSHCNGNAATHEEAARVVADKKDAGMVLEANRRQLAEWGMENPNYQLGQELVFDPGQYQVTSDVAESVLIQRDYRKGFEFPTI